MWGLPLAAISFLGVKLGYLCPFLDTGGHSVPRVGLKRRRDSEHLSNLPIGIRLLGWRRVAQSSRAASQVRPSPRSACAGTTVRLCLFGPRGLSQNVGSSRRHLHRAQGPRGPGLCVHGRTPLPRTPPGASLLVCATTCSRSPGPPSICPSSTLTCALRVCPQASCGRSQPGLLSVSVSALQGRGHTSVLTPQRTGRRVAQAVPALRESPVSPVPPALQPQRAGVGRGWPATPCVCWRAWGVGLRLGTGWWVVP